MPDPPLESITALQPKDWMKTFMEIFKNDTAYGFDNRNDPTKNVFKQYNVVFSLPESVLQVPAIWIVCEGMESLEKPQSTVDFLYDFMAHIDVYGVVKKNTEVTYNDSVWVVPGVQHPEHPNNVLFLLMEYIGKKIEDNPDITASGIQVNVSHFVSVDFYLNGLQNLRDARAVRIGMVVQVQLG